MAIADRALAEALEALDSVPLVDPYRDGAGGDRPVRDGAGPMTSDLATERPVRSAPRVPGGRPRRARLDAARSRATGRASSRPTSRWTPRTSCCASSSASAPTRRRQPPPSGSAPTSATTAPGPTSTAARPSSRRPSRPTSLCGWPATRPTRRTCAGPPSSCASRAASRRPGSSPGSGWRCSACGPGRTCRCSRPSSIFLPHWFPLNIYDFACWARQTVVALTVVSHYRPVRPLGVRIDELFSGRRPVVHPPLSTWAGRLTLLDRLLHRYERRPLRFLRRAALAKAERWIVEHQENDGGWGGIQPPWVYSIMALELRGYPLDHPVLRGALAGLDGFTIDDDAGRRLEACQSPVWDTVLAIIALADAGLKPDDPVLDAAARWVVDEEIEGGGTGRSAGRPSRRAAGPSSSRTTGTPTSTTRPRWCSRWPGPRRRPTPRSTAPSRGSSACSARTVGGPHSTWTTPGRCAASTRSATSASSSTRRART